MADRLMILASCEAVAPRKDKSWSIRFSTQEPNESQVNQMLGSYTNFGVLVFVAGKEQMNQSELDELDNLDMDIYNQPKTQSQRIRGVLYKNWEQDNEGYEEFKKYYKFKTDVIINHFKQKLEP